MFERFASTFLEPRGRRWFRSGLVIESAAPATAVAGLSKLRDALPGVVFDLLTKTGRPEMGFRHAFLVRRALGGVRLLLRARNDYHLVVLFATGERALGICRACALLFMRPRRFFVFNEFGEGFWLHREDWGKIRGHFERRYNWQGKRWRLRQWRDRILARLRPFGRAALWLALSPYRLVLLLGAAALFAPAALLLAVLRACYDKYYCRFRIFGKWARCTAGILPAGEAGVTRFMAAGHAPSPAHPRRARRLTPAADRDLRTDRLTITGACDGLAWTPGSVQLNDENFISLWVSGLPAAAECEDVRARLDSFELAVEYVGPHRSAPRQVNARIPAGVAPGQYQLFVSVGTIESRPLPIELMEA